MVRAIEPIAVVIGPDARNGFRMNSSVVRPTSPATRNATVSEGTTGQAKVAFTTKPAKAPTVMCEASAKFVNRSTANIAVRPMAGTARVVPDISPLRKSCQISIARYPDRATGTRRDRATGPVVHDGIPEGLRSAAASGMTGGCTARAASDDLQELQLAIHHLHV